MFPGIIFDLWCKLNIIKVSSRIQILYYAQYSFNYIYILQKHFIMFKTISTVTDTH